MGAMTERRAPDPWPTRAGLPPARASSAPPPYPAPPPAPPFGGWPTAPGADGGPPPRKGAGLGGPEEADRLRPPVGLQNLLLGLGTALVAVSVVVFTAVNWSRLDAGLQGLVLVAVTIAAGTAATLAARRGMPSTAEALGTVAVLLALADVHACRVGFAPAADAAPFWAVGFAVVALLAGSLGRAGSIRAPQILAGVLGQLPLACGLAWAEAEVAVAQLALVGQALLVVTVADRIDVPRWARRLAVAWALAVAAVLTAATLLDSVLAEVMSEGDPHRVATAGSALAASTLALVIARRRRTSSQAQVVALVAATLLALAAVWFGSMAGTGPGTSIGVVALAAALIVLGSRRLSGAWADVPAWTAGTVGVGAVLPLGDAMASMLTAASVVGAQAWERSGSQLAADLQLAEAPSYGTAGLALQLAAVAVAVVALGRRGSKLALGVAGSVVVLVAMVISPLLVPLTITATVLVGLVAASAGVGVAVVLGGRRRGFPVAVGFAGLSLAWAAPWSLATPGLTFALLGVGIAAGAVIAVIARRDGAAPVAVAAAAWVTTATPTLAGLIAWDAGMSSAMAWAVASVVTVLLGTAGAMVLDLRQTRGIDRAVRQSVELTALVGYLVVLVATARSADPDATSVALAAGVIGFGLQAVRPGRLLLGLPAAVELLALTWLRLDQAEVVLVEAYTLPLAAVLLAIGLLAQRIGRSDGVEVPSWISLGPALVVGLAPTVWLASTEPGSVRPLVGLVAGALVLIVGVTRGRRALVDVGTATVVALGLRQIAPVVGEVPNWLTIGATGVLLIVVGATFEQRRRDLRALLRRYAALT